MHISLTTIEVMDASLADMVEIEAIYSYHVLKTLVSFEEVPPSIEELNNRRLTSQEKGLPFLVAKKQGKVVGYSYAAQYRTRSGYRFTVEDSVYVHSDHKAIGVGTRLLAEVIKRCQENGYRQMIAVIAGSENEASIRLHSKLGFVTSGVLKEVGFKFNSWVDIILMQKSLSDK